MAPRGFEVAFCTMMPCELCAVLLVNFGIRKLFFSTPYRKADGLDVLDAARVKVIRLKHGSEIE
jgi:deoxycytidylate deaminase